MELKEEMYVRTKKGIAKILGRINDPTNFYHKMLITDKFLKIHGDTEYIHDLDIIKARKNITDLLQVGDVVTMFSDLHDILGNETFNIRDKKHLDYIKMGVNRGFFHLIDVVTKEKFNEIKYEVE